MPQLTHLIASVPTADEKLDTRITLSFKLYISLLQFAIDRRKSIIKIIEQMFLLMVQIDNFIEAILPETIKDWRQDLTEL